MPWRLRLVSDTDTPSKNNITELLASCRNFIFCNLLFCNSQLTLFPTRRKGFIKLRLCQVRTTHAVKCKNIVQQHKGRAEWSTAFLFWRFPLIISHKMLLCANAKLKMAPVSHPAFSRLLVLYILTCKTFKQPLQMCSTCRSVFPSDIVCAELQPQRRRQESLLLAKLGVLVCVWESVRASVSVCEARSVKEFIVCSPPVIILVPINLLASLEPVAIWKHCSVYKLGKDQHSGALTSHTNLETIRARQSGWLLRKGPAWIPLTTVGKPDPC